MLKTVLRSVASQQQKLMTQQNYNVVCSILAQKTNTVLIKLLVGTFESDVLIKDLVLPANTCANEQGINCDRR